jgi:histidinol dehydrogenase
MKLVKTFGRGKAAAEALIEALERRGAVNRRRRLSRSCGGFLQMCASAAMRRCAYAAKFDGLAKDAALLVSRRR